MATNFKNLHVNNLSTNSAIVTFRRKNGAHWQRERIDSTPFMRTLRTVLANP